MRPAAVPALALAAALALAGCAGAPPAPPADAVAAPPPSPHADGLSPFETRQRVRALVLEDEQRWAEAAWAWEVLIVLRPGHAPYRERAAALRRRIDAAVAEQLARGQAARRRGATDQAANHYLHALALQPDQPEAADALRALERERNQRLYLGRLSRLTMSLRGALVTPVRAQATMPAIGEGMEEP
ncbi:hypothetical protein [Pseudorhodoferax sp.]|uniref:hypothetical protein n=1 Tax=Pseudorhodoferax sp. TaxID=1993553 RepID=UPI0039E4275F